MNPGDWNFGEWLMYSAAGCACLFGAALAAVLTVGAIWDAFRDDRGRR